MKVCIVSLNALPALSRDYQHLYAGGAEVQLARFAIALARLGHDVRMIVNDFGQPDGAVYEGVQTTKAFRPAAGWPVVRFVHPRLTGLWRAIARADANVYYFSCAGMLLGVLALYCRLHGRRLVFRAASDADCDPRTVALSGRDRWLYEFGLKRADAVLVQSATQQAAMQRNYGVHGTVIRGLVEGPNAIAPESHKDIDVLWVANLRPLKRPDRFVELARRLPNFRFHMAGGEVPGDESYFGEVERQARAVPNLTFHGKVPYAEVGRLFDRARLLANTSEVEGFPNTFMQAWVREIPVVTMFDPDGVVARERLGSSHATVVELAAGVEQLLQSSDAYEAARARVRAYTDQRFDSAAVLQPYLEALTGGTASAVQAGVASADGGHAEASRG